MDIVNIYNFTQVFLITTGRRLRSLIYSFETTTISILPPHTRVIGLFVKYKFSSDNAAHEHVMSGVENS